MSIDERNYNILKCIKMNRMAHTGNAEKIQNMFGISICKKTFRGMF